MLTSPTPRELGDFLGEAGVGQVLDLVQRQTLRSQGQGQDRRIGRVDFAVDRRARQIGRQEAARRVDRRLNLLLGDIEVQVQSELQGDHRGAAGAGR
jgi:hypothetical protein